MIDHRTAELAGRLTVILEACAEGLAGLRRRPDGPPSFGACGKQCVEASLLLACARRAPIITVRSDQALGAIGEHLHSIVRTDPTATMLRRLPRLVLSGVGTVHAVLTEIGLVDDRFMQEVEWALRCPHSRTGERLPFRELEGDWLRWKVLRDSAKPWRHISELAAICGRPHPIYMTQQDLDAVTHGLWYLTDFGRLPPLGVDAAGLSSGIDLMIAWQANLGAADEIAELLAARAVLRRRASGHSGAALVLIDRRWAELAPRLGPSAAPSDLHAAIVHGLLYSLDFPGALQQDPVAADPQAFHLDGDIIRALRRYDLAEAVRLLDVASTTPGLASRSLALPEARSFLSRQLNAGEESTAWMLISP